MSTPINDGGPAFPHFKTNEQGKTELCPQGGMTLRDYFAAKALNAFISLPNTRGTETEFAVWSYAFADAMLAARKEVTK
jgi:hypothetical protein